MIIVEAAVQPCQYGSWYRNAPEAYRFFVHIDVALTGPRDAKTATRPMARARARLNQEACPCRSINVDPRRGRLFASNVAEPDGSAK
jgi:hypothetical protein